MEQVLALAPDSSSASAGRGLAAPKKWVSLGASEGALWGECQGSGSKPYQTAVELGTPSFHCSCPSRKFPCKHGLGLMLLWAGQPGALGVGEPPAWVASWLEGRAKRAEVKAAKEEAKKEKAERGESPGDAEARRKREEARGRKVSAGLEELDLWLSDLVREGIATAQGRPHSYWDERARRLIDAQAPGAARMVREIGELSLTREGWQDAMLERLGQLHLLAEAYRRLETLPTEVQEDVRATVGISVALDAVRAGPGVRDHWLVVGRRVELEDGLRVRRVWLVGRETERPALVLDFAHASQPMDAGLPPGVGFDGELAFFPGSAPLRAVLKCQEGELAPIPAMRGFRSIRESLARFAETLAKNPWTMRSPMVLEGVRLIRRGEGWKLRDEEGTTLAVSHAFKRGWELLAATGHEPFTVAGEWDAETFLPLSAWHAGRFQGLVAADADETTEPRATTFHGPAGLSAAWDGVKASALVGVERRAPSLPIGDEALMDVLGGLEQASPPARLLGLAAALPLYARVGRTPNRDTEDPPPPCPADEHRECPEAAAVRLRTLLDEHYGELLPEWLERLKAAGYRLPAGTLVEVLERGRRSSELRRAIMAVLGRRGHWIAAQNEAWEYAASDAMETGAEAGTVWQVGSRADRIAVLESLRGTDPGQGRALLESTWATEKAEDRAEFLETFERGLGAEDETFLEAALEDRSKLVRRVAAVLLSRLPGSRYGARMAERARGVASWVGRFRKKLAVEPPSACDAAMSRDGIEPKPPSGTGERAWWLRQLVALTPLRTWVELLGEKPDELVRAGHGSGWPKELWTGWAEAAVRQRDESWACALLSEPPKAQELMDQHAGPLLACLSATTRDKVLIARIESDDRPLTSQHPALGLLAHMEPPLGADLVRLLLKRLAVTFVKESASKKHQYDYPLWLLVAKLGRLVPVDQAEEARRILARAAEDDGYFRDAVRQQLEILRFRAEMLEELAR